MSNRRTPASRKRSSSGAATRTKAKRSPGLGAVGQKALPLTVVRSSLSPLLRQLERTQGTVGIAIHGKIRGYLVPPKAYEALRTRAEQAGRRRKMGRPALYGSLTLVGDLEEGSRRIGEALEASIARSAGALR